MILPPLGSTFCCTRIEIEYCPYCTYMTMDIQLIPKLARNITFLEAAQETKSVKSVPVDFSQRNAPTRISTGKGILLLYIVSLYVALYTYDKEISNSSDLSMPDSNLFGLGPFDE